MIWGCNRKCKVYKIPSNPVAFCGHHLTFEPPTHPSCEPPTHPPLKIRQRARLALNKVLSTWPNFVQNKLVLGKNPTGPHIEDRLLNDNLKETSKPGRGSSMAVRKRWEQSLFQNLNNGDHKKEDCHPGTILVGNLGNNCYDGNHKQDCQSHENCDWAQMLQNFDWCKKPPRCKHVAK